MFNVKMARLCFVNTPLLPIAGAAFSTDFAQCSRLRPMTVPRSAHKNRCSFSSNFRNEVLFSGSSILGRPVSSRSRIQSNSALSAVVCLETAVADSAVKTAVQATPVVKFVNRNTDAPMAWEGDLFVICMFSDADYFPSADLSDMKSVTALDMFHQGAIKDLINENEFEGKSGQVAIGRVGGGSKVGKLALIGLGSMEEATMDMWRRTGGAIADLAKSNRLVKNMGVYLPVGVRGSAGPNTAQALIEGATLGLYEDLRYKSEAERTKKKPPMLTSIDLLGFAILDDEALVKAKRISSGVLLARDLVNSPANDMNPVKLAEVAVEIGQENGLETEILEREDCAKLGMGLFLGVSQASDIPPKFIHLTYKPEGEVTRKIAIIGKGLTFDSGGLNLKAGAGSMIEMMKIDMAGAAAALGTAKAIGQLKPPGVEVHFVIAACENMINGNAIRPGDVLVASNGVTVEVNNTDAEGRLTLADAIIFTEKLGVDAIVDCATLTGACIVALGNDIAGLWSTEDKLAGELLEAAKLGGEKIWRMPLEDRYAELNKSSIADIKNSGGRMGGSITAALFLKHFVKSVPWAHIDMAGPVFSEKSGGATGFGVRMLVNFILGEDAAVDG
mmetsp:Transcript_24929/g.41072  ORF Transcript_24929/g.41072 Transcript_24929/m.41072 type:complete len:616 (-) Transcript_24929:405-2252(-)